MRTGALGRAGNGAKVAHIGHAVEGDDERGLVLGNTLQDILQLNILDQCGLCHDTLVVALREAIELLDRHLLVAQTMTCDEVFELLHQRTLGTLADVEFLDLLACLDGLGHRTDSKNQIFSHIY